MRSIGLWSSSTLSLLLVCGCVSDSNIIVVGADASAQDTSTPPVDASTTPDASATATVSIAPDMPVLRQGSMLTVAVTFTRNGLTGPIALVASGAPSGVTIAVTPIGDGTSTTQMLITTDAMATTGSAQITLKAANVTNFTFTLVVQGPSGSLDTSFNGAGSVLDSTLASGLFNAVAPQADGAVIVAGADSTGWLIRRYNSDGTLDKTFSTNAATISPTSGAARSIAFDPKQGRIVIVGSINSEVMGVVRLNADGTPDHGLNQNGFVNISQIDFGGGGTRGNGALVLPDSTIVVAGQMVQGKIGLVVRFLENGTLDTNYTFNNGGGDMNAVIPLAGNEFFVVGSTYPPNPPNPQVLKMFNNGSFDSTFGAAGKQSISKAQCTITSATLTSTGDIFMVGGFNGFPSLCEVRVNAAGVFQWDSGGFVPGGQMGGATAGPKDTVYDDGWYGGSQNRNGFIRRWLPSGAPDTTFASTGQVLYQDNMTPNRYTLMFKGITTLKDGRIVAVGGRTGISTPGPIIYRLWP